MNILHTVEFYHPFIGGAQEVVRQISEHMVKQGHNVTVATTRMKERKSRVFNGVKIEEFDITGNWVTEMKGETERYQNFLLKSNFDVILNYAAQQWTTDLTLPLLDKIKSKKFFVPCGYSGLNTTTYKEYFDILPQYLKLYDASIYMSSNYKDIQFARDHKISHLEIIPNGVDRSEFQDIDLKYLQDFRQRLDIGDKFFIVTIGTHTGSKGHRESIYAYLLANIPNSVLMIIGNECYICSDYCRKWAARSSYFKHLLHKRIIVPQLNREETVTALKTADLFLFLSNQEYSPLVLFEAAAAGVPFVCSTAGNSQEICEWTEGGIAVPGITKPNGYVKPSILKAAQAATKLYKDRQTRQRMSEKGREVVMKKYTWDILAQKYLDTYQKYLKRE